MTQSVLSLPTRQQIRQQVRQRRRGLSARAQRLYARRACARALAYPPIAQARRLAVFLSFDGELNTRPLIDALWRNGQQVYLPVLHPFSRGNLLFVHYSPQTAMTHNVLNIAEPRLDVRAVLPLNKLDTIIVPMVAFDRTGQRLGMGGGFYDRTLQNWRQHGFTPVGYAHDCQQVEALPSESWDIPLPTIITPSRLWQW
ncbi:MULTISPECIES: 5-formyltetrahydrofolate cyclo-ligase [Tenebrionibacter/Tenebrionicola group]|jgi:5-formyltetrahydrofolate cyclo-ligase|uniref:5-formyltetrahydrofolate cyclo-ligase n=2 Tax=Tenebrionibacter/Tenebrionicola group TaxID=2969848 RepID=A0A8K0V5U7_9ENTR|nr:MULTISPECIES: 5-formyltetrahydrofolate cyclo-ligase [Tenebrionibacter/Tenebrionicola group]MBK4716331.1 5-formyltetrahydrofolate cyclo-ligase [Tenebrionibacter intestinalis]MBV5096711.1 5-formyltetrahydrofolate cyclo-ligase [Tenebrionicola larvae]